MRLQIFGIDGQRFFEFGDRIGVALFEEEHAAKLVVDDAVARILLEDGFEMRDGAFIIAVFAKSFGVKEIGARELCVNGQRFFEHFARAGGVAFLQKHTSDVGPAVGILRVGFGDFFECRGSAFQIAL